MEDAIFVSPQYPYLGLDEKRALACSSSYSYFIKSSVDRGEGEDLGGWTKENKINPTLIPLDWGFNAVGGYERIRTLWGSPPPRTHTFI